MYLFKAGSIALDLGKMIKRLEYFKRIKDELSQSTEAANIDVFIGKAEACYNKYMATANKNLSDYDKATIPNAKDFRFGIVVSEWNDTITEGLYQGAYEALLDCGA